LQAGQQSALSDFFGRHGHGVARDSELFWAYVATDILIGLAYVAISATLIYLVWSGRREFPFQRVFIAFGLFIVACGATHFMGVFTLWAPVYGMGIAVQMVTAVASVGTALLLPPLVPKVLKTMRSAKLSEQHRVRAESAERFQVMADTLPQIVWTAAADGSAEYYNRRWYEHIGVAGVTGHGSTWHELIHPDDLGATVEAWNRAVGSGQDFEITHRIRRADGSYSWMLSRGVPARDDRGEIVQWFGSATDVQDQKRVEEELRVAKAEAERASRAKTDFLSTMSHELRTPLNAIAGYVDLMEAGVQGPLNEDQHRGLLRIKSNQRHLLALINDVLQFSTMEAGHLDFHFQELRAWDILADVAALIEPQVAASGVEYSWTGCDPDLRVLADPDRLRQILLNLVTNALKFTPSGGEIEARCLASGDHARIEVRDTGCGIPPGMLERIFDPFIQVRQNVTPDPSRQGVGLGLSISRDLARGMRGDLTVRSEEGKGSTFTVVLPLAGAGEQPERRGVADRRSGEDRRVPEPTDGALLPADAVTSTIRGGGPS
jgi:PAS domain S-box-containing protein